MTADRYTLYGVEASYYAAKPRSYLLQKPLPFVDLVADRAVFDEIILPKIGFPVVPVVVTPAGEILQDSSIIIEELEKRHPDNPLIPTTPKKRFVSYLLELFADEWFKIPALHYRWYYDAEFAQRMMGEMNDPAASREDQWQVGKKIARQFSSWPKHLGVDENTRRTVELLFLDYLRLLNGHFSEHEFVLGGAPGLADCALMGPLYAHLYRDPYSGKIVRDEAPHVCDWIARMRTPASEDRDSKLSRAADAEDEVPTAIVELIQAINADYVPMILDAVGQTREWLQQHTTEELPRYLGEHEFTLAVGKPYEVRGIRSIHAVEQWKFQRVLGKYDSEPENIKDAINSLCEELGFSDCLAEELRLPIERRNFKLHAATVD
ncbi:MAG TPA: glutathione S-transferase [Sneathiellales bacterium]|nr:glutathione S-transferase [Sneathiellales bacterium]